LKEIRILYIRVSEIPGGGLDVFAARGRSAVPRLLEGMDPAPLKTCRLADAELLLTAESGDLWAEGSFAAEGEAPCDRCSEPVAVRFGKAFRSLLVPKGRGPAGTGQAELREDDLDVGYYDGKGIKVNDIFWEQVALELPLKVVCSEDCRGICPVCGANRNREPCSCPADASLGPFDVLKNLKGKKE
jgi:uncharacterized protein